MKRGLSFRGACVALALGLSCSAMAQLTPGSSRGGIQGGIQGGAAAPADDFTRGLGRGRPWGGNQAAASRSEPIWTFGVESRLTVSDNIGLDPPGQERDGVLLEVSPYVRATVNRPRLQGQLSYAMRNFYTSPDVGYEGPNHDVRALGNAALKDDWLWLAGQALVYEVSRSPFDATAADPASRQTNRTRYARYDLSPYVRGWIGPQTSYQTGYAFNAIKFGDDNASSTAHQVYGRIQRDPALHRLGWQAGADASRREFDNGADYDTTNALLAALYRVSRSVTVGAGAAYTRISVVSTTSGETDGWGPTVLLNWTPSPRTALSLQATHAYYGDAGTARLSHQAANWTLGLRYDQGIVDGSEAGLTYADNRTPLRSGQHLDQTNPVTDELGDRGTTPAFGTPLASGLLGGALVDNRRLVASIGWLRQRNAVALTVFASRSETVQTTVPLPSAIGGLNELEQRGARLGFDRRLSPRTIGSLQGAFTRSETVGGTISSDLTVFDAVLSHQYSQMTTVSVGYRRSSQRGSAEYRENAILATLNLRFR